MARILLFFFLLFIIFPENVSGQTAVDSLHRAFKKSEGVPKGELAMELAARLITEYPDSSLYYSAVSKEIGKQNSNPKLIIRAYATSGEAYQKQNKIKEAIASYLSGLKLAEKYNEKSLAGTIYNGIAVCYFYRNDLVKAEQYLKLAAQAKKDAKDYRYYSLIATNIAVLQITNKSFTNAIKTLKEAEQTLLKNKQPEYLPTVYNSLGAAYQSVAPDSCLFYYQKSVAIASQQKDYLNMMTAYQNIGDFYLEQKNFPGAIEYMKEAIAINELRPEDQYKPALYDRISVLYETAGDLKNAFKYKKLETEVRQKLSSAEKQKEIDELEIKYQTEKKENEIQLNRQEIAEGKHQRNLVLFGALLLFIIAGFITYLLFQRRKITQQFEQEKLKLFENIFHEIRTPLTMIDGPIQMMKQQPENLNTEQLVLMERNSKKLTRLVNELLDASKLGKGSFQLQYAIGNISDFIEDIITGYRAEAGSAEINIVSDINIEDGMYSFPSNAVEKIVANLLGNAIKYCPAQSQIDIRAKVEGEMLTFEIKDNGHGIPKTEQKKVFRRFFRGTHSAGTNGTGIGLSMVKELVDLTSGTIKMDSNSSGTAFLVEIPLQVSEQTIATTTISADENTPTLLLAEDDPDTAAFTISVLRDSFKVVHVSNGQLAIYSIRTELPDIVLSDIMMPEMDGIDLLREIRFDEVTSHIPVVLFSAKASLESRLEGLNHGADAYIAKPFSPEELKLTVLNLYTTIQRNREAYKESIQSAKTFDERIKSTNSYVNKVIGCVIKNIDDADYSVDALADDMAISRSQLHRKLTALTGFSTTNFVRTIRLEKAKDLLQNNDGNVSEIAFKCGFSSQSYFTKSFTEHFGKSPVQFLNNQ